MITARQVPASTGTTAPAPKAAEDAGMDDEVIIVGERIHSGGDAEVGPARKRRKLKLKQTQLPCAWLRAMSW